jgi:ABC-2 type transport system ATP-binding protein
MTGRRNLRLLADYDEPRSRSLIEGLLELVELRDRGDDRVGGYSHGMRQRLGIAASLLREPRLLLLDEPTTGLDPAGMRDMRALVQRLAGEGITVLLSSHLLAEVEELCNRVAIIRKGRIVYQGSLAELKQAGGQVWRLQPTDVERARAILSARGAGDVAAVDGELRFSAGEDAVAALTVALGQAGIGITRLTADVATLEELFLELTETEDPEEPAAGKVAA